MISVSLAPASYFFSAAQTYGAGKVEAAMVASAPALKSRRDGFLVIVVFSLVRALCWEGSIARK
ncbi:hypothetical protein [Bradyrhizobium arachidis]|uniref:hypothetical protein n=1 Tax=Bradyrhizobium arachidis TaxID=858423 RepID=UPI001FCD88FF|nr:hypothetical protein [Bradyrhizobium arachidis]